MNMDILGQKLVTKIWESLVDNGICGLLTPWQIRRTGRAHTDVRRAEILTISQAEKDAEDIKKGIKRLDNTGQLISIENAIASTAQVQESDSQEQPFMPVDTMQFIRSARTEAIIQQTRWSINLSKIILQAEQEAMGVPNEKVSDHRIDPDWIARWRDSAQDITSEEMQQLWARILVEEGTRPGSYSLRTIEAIRTLTQEEAKIIEIIAPYVIDDVIMGLGITKLLQDGMPKNYLFKLRDMGIIHYPLEETEWSIDTQRSARNGSKVILLKKQDPCSDTIHIRLHGCHVTEVGRQITSLATFESNIDYLSSFAQEIRSRYPLEIYMGDARSNPEGVFEAINLIPLPVRT